MPNDWTPTSWQTKPATQQPLYPDLRELNATVERLSRLPPLVTSWEVDALKRHLAAAAAGRQFVLQGGDCAESFADCESSSIANKLKILLQMSLVLVHGLKKPVVRIGRIAGQYAKPRSAEMETRGDKTLWSYRGDLVNESDFTEAARMPNPQLLLRGYERAALTLNFVRSLAEGGFADLHHPENWDLRFMVKSPQAEQYHRMVASIGESLRFMESLAGSRVGEINRVDFFTSHEGLHLTYEQAQTRQVPRRPGWYNLSTHLPWIGDRTRHLEGAHVEYFRGIVNPIGVKVGNSIAPEELTTLIDILHPTDEPGRLTLIHRFGARKIAQSLPPLINAVRRTGKTVLWVCDPMHGNTESTSDGIKTRDFANIRSELEHAFDIHQSLGSILGGVHFELTGEDVTECIGGSSGVETSDLPRAYKTLVDPRLNYEQALEMAMLIANHSVKINAK